MPSKDREKTKKIVSLIIRSDLGLEEIKKDALEILADIFERYIQAVGFFSAKYAEHAHRQSPNVLDLLRALEKIDPFSLSLGSLLEYLREQDKRLKTAGLHQNTIIDFILPRDHPPEPRSLPIPTEEQRTVPEYIPAHFPSLPPLHTYAQTLCTGIRDDQPWYLAFKKEVQQRDIERDVHNLIERIDDSNTKEQKKE